jgi:hypothetical protein
MDRHDHMDHSRRSSGTGFADDFDEFDRLLEDDDDEQPIATSGPVVGATRTKRPAAPRRSLKPRGTRPAIRITPDWNRVAAVGFVVAVVLFVLWFAVSSIMGARREGAYKDYFGKVRDIASTSSSQGDQLDSIINSPDGGDRAERIAQIEELSTRADKLVTKARALDVPDQLVDAQAFLVQSLEYRASGLDAVQRSLGASAGAKDQDAAAKAVAEAMARLVASDVVYADSFAVASRSALKQDDVNGVTVADSPFITDLEMVSPKGLSSTLDRLASSVSTKSKTAVAGGCAEGKICGGQLQTGSITVDPSGQTLDPTGVTEIKGGDNIAFEVPFMNQGEVQLTQVPVKITLRGADSDPMTLTGIIDSVDPGQTATAKVPLDEIPNFGEVLDMDVLVGPIPGEKTADNNRGSFQLQFSL